MPDVDEHDGEARVEAEDAHAGERCVRAAHERQEVGQRGHGDGDGGVAVAPKNEARREL